MRLSSLLFCLCVVSFPVMAAGQGLQRSGPMRFLYDMGVSDTDTSDPTMRQQLLQLREAGINVLSLDGWDAAAFQKLLPTLKADPLFSRFKYVLKIHPHVSSNWAANPTQVCSDAANGVLPADTAQLLDGVAAFGKQNADYVVGYYTFDEPSNKGVNNGTTICWQYQQLVYQRLRSGDPDSTDRPVITANTLYPVAPEDIKNSVSPNAQDIVFVDQYSTDPAVQATEYKDWGNMLKKVVPVFPAFSNNITTCQDPMLRTQFRPAVQSGLNTAYGANQPAVAGIAYFAFYPGRTYAYDAQNCAPIFNSVVDDLQHDPIPVMTKIEPSLNLILSCPASSSTAPASSSTSSEPCQ
jgi:hypothetical protein